MTPIEYQNQLAAKEERLLSKPSRQRTKAEQRWLDKRSGVPLAACVSSTGGTYPKSFVRSGLASHLESR